MGASDTDRPDRFGFDENGDGSAISEFLARFVPQPVAKRALTIDVETDSQTYAVGDDIRFRVTFQNRLPLPIAVQTPDRRLWGWTVDGELEASDEPRFADPTRETPGTFAFRGGERKTVSRTWHGRVRRVGDEGPTRWVDLDPGRHELGVFLAYDGGARATTAFEIRD